jgi:hypothetical protein
MPRLVICFGYKYEPEFLINDLRENIAGIADEVFEFDSRSRNELWIPRDEFNNTLRRGAIERDADYMLVVAPDERLEKRAGKIIRELVNRDKPVSYRFNLRELYTPTAYRTDGIWGKKRRIRLHYMRGKSTTRNVDLNIYHTKHIEPENRTSRAEIHSLTNTADNKHLGFDYLADETGMILEEIPGGREFYPPYTRKYIFEIPEIYRQHVRG